MHTLRTRCSPREALAPVEVRAKGRSVPKRVPCHAWRRWMNVWGLRSLRYKWHSRSLRCLLTLALQLHVPPLPGAALWLRCPDRRSDGAWMLDCALDGCVPVSPSLFHDRLHYLPEWFISLAKLGYPCCSFCDVPSFQPCQPGCLRH